jgi:hypothetical protein
VRLCYGSAVTNTTHSVPALRSLFFKPVSAETPAPLPTDRSHVTTLPIFESITGFHWRTSQPETSVLPATRSVLTGICFFAQIYIKFMLLCCLGSTGHCLSQKAQQLLVLLGPLSHFHQNLSQSSALSFQFAQILLLRNLQVSVI